MRVTARANELGIGLVETLIAIGITTIIVTSMVSLSIFTVRSSLQNKLTLEGTQLANQQIEQVRAFRDARTWAEFLAAVDGTDGADCFSTDCYAAGFPPDIFSGPIRSQIAGQAHHSAFGG